MLVQFEGNEAACKILSQCGFRIEPKVAESQQFVGIILSMANFAMSFRVSQVLF